MLTENEIFDLIVANQKHSWEGWTERDIQLRTAKAIFLAQNPTQTPDFEKYLSDIHAKQYTGIDDEMGSDFDRWLTELDADELINYANEFAALRASRPAPSKRKSAEDIAKDSIGHIKYGSPKAKELALKRCADAIRAERGEK